MSVFILILLTVAIFGYFFRKQIRNSIAPDKKRNYTIDDLFNDEKVEREKEIDKLLSKMGKNGIDDLSASERKRLDELSKK